MTIQVIILIFVFAFGGAFIQRVTGFGFGIFAMTALPYLMPSYGEATTLSGLLALLCSAITGIRFMKHMPWKKLAVILPVFLVTSFFFIGFINHIDAHRIKLYLGITLIIISIYFFFASDSIHLKPTFPVQASMGALSGVLGGLFAMQGPPAIIYFTSSTDTKEEYMAISQWYFFIGNVFMTVVRAQNGFLTEAVGYGTLAGIPAVIFGLLLGFKINRRLPIGIMRKCIYAFMAASGLFAIFS